MHQACPPLCQATLKRGDCTERRRWTVVSRLQRRAIVIFMLREVVTFTAGCSVGNRPLLRTIILLTVVGTVQGDVQSLPAETDRHVSCLTALSVIFYAYPYKDKDKEEALGRQLFRLKKKGNYFKTVTAFI